MNRVIDRRAKACGFFGRAGLVLALLIAFAAPAAGADDDVRARDWQHVREVLFGALGESSYRGLWVNRWTEPPVLMLLGATDDDRAFVERTVAAYNRLLGAHAMVIEEGDTHEVSVALMFAPRRKIPGLAVRHGMQPNIAKRGAGYTETLIRPDHAIQASLTLIIDELEAAERRATIVHELYHALGPGGHSTVHADSVVYGDGEASSTATELAAIDVKVLGLLYRHLAPGAAEADVRAAFDAHWAALDSLVAQYSASNAAP